jgi:hypothetical protein
MNKTLTLSDAVVRFLMEDRAPSASETNQKALNRVLRLFGPHRAVGLLSHDVLVLIRPVSLVY